MITADWLQEFHAAAGSDGGTGHHGAGYLSRALLSDALRARATDIHIDPYRGGGVIRFRIDGEVLKAGTLSEAIYLRLLNQIKTEADIDPGVVFLPRGSRNTYEIGSRELDVRLMLAPCIGGQKLALRLLDPERIKHRVDDLGLSSKGMRDVRRWLDELNGMFLVAGPTGSGKTTTLYALLHELSDHDRNIVTIEDPVEYEIDGINQIQIDSRHGLDFAEGIKAVLRMDPDYILVGEMRDAGSAKSAANAAVAGHVLLSTIHARNTVSAITSLRNFGLTDHQVATMLAVVVNQRLVRKLCPDCRRRMDFESHEREWLKAAGYEGGLARGWVADGCGQCGGTGYHGRIGIFEIWHLDDSDYELLLANADERTLRKRLAQHGHQSLLESGLESVADGVTSLGEIRRSGCTP